MAVDLCLGWPGSSESESDSARLLSLLLDLQVHSAPAKNNISISKVSTTMYTYIFYGL